MKFLVSILRRMHAKFSIVFKFRFLKLHEITYHGLIPRDTKNREQKIVRNRLLFKEL